MFNGTIGEIRLLVFKQSSAGKHHMFNEMFMFDQCMLRVDLWFSVCPQAWPVLNAVLFHPLVLFMFKIKFSLILCYFPIVSLFVNSSTD